MHCPVCKNYSLKIHELEPGLKSQECPHCKGRWIGSYLYWKWKEATGKCLTETPAGTAETAVKDTLSAKLCPECGHFLRRYPVGEGLGFSLDRCGNCGGTWFDQNEWEALKAKNLHDDVHLIFSNMWQNQIRDIQQQNATELIYKKLFGEKDFEKIRQIKDWISKHPHSSELKAFLNR